MFVDPSSRVRQATASYIARLVGGRFGETYDFEFRPNGTTDVTIEVVRPGNSYPAEITPSGKAVELRPASGVVVKVPVTR